MTHPEVVIEKNLIKGNQQGMVEQPRELGALQTPPLKRQRERVAVAQRRCDRH